MGKERTFIVKQKGVDSPPGDDTCVIKYGPPPDLREQFELMYGRTNCGLQYLLGENWAKYGWKYCEELGLPQAPFMVSRDMHNEELLKKADVADLPANHPRVGPWGHATTKSTDEQKKDEL